MPELPTDAATILAIERAVIGGVLHGCTIPPLHVAEFFKDGHRIIWAALLNVATTHGRVDMASLAQHLARRDELGEIGGWEALVQIEDEGAFITSANLPGYAGQIRDSYRKREEARIGRLLNAGEIRGDEARRLLAELPELRSNGNGSSLVYRRLDSIAEQPVVWQWEKYVAAGMVNLVAGEPDIGKSLLLADMAARLTSGRPWPDGAPGAPVGTVMFLSAEDGAANTLRPRIRVAGGDLSRVLVVDAVRDESDHERPVSLVKDIAKLESLIRQHHVTTLFIDPVFSYVGGGTNTNSDSGVRAILDPLGKLAERTSCAIVALIHLNKDSERKALYRVMGSVAFTAMARSVLFMARGDRGQRFLKRHKANYLRDSEKRKALVFDTVEAETDIPVISWGTEAVDVDLEDVLRGEGAKRELTALDRAAKFLEETFASTRIVAATTLDRAAKEQGISQPTLSRARGKFPELKSIRLKKIGGKRGDGLVIWVKGVKYSDRVEYPTPGELKGWIVETLKASPETFNLSSIQYFNIQSQDPPEASDKKNGEGRPYLLFRISPGDMLRLQDAMVDAEGRTMTDERHGEPLPGQPGLFELLDVTDCGPGSTFRWTDRPKLGTGSPGRRETIRYASRCVVPYTNIPATVIEVTLVGDKPRLRDVTGEYTITADDFRLA